MASKQELREWLQIAGDKRHEDLQRFDAISAANVKILADLEAQLADSADTIAVLTEDLADMTSARDQWKSAAQIHSARHIANSVTLEKIRALTA